MAVMATRPTRSLPAVLAASLAAIGASVCCVVPLVLALMGISGAWIANLTALDAWRPWFTAATLACLALAYWTLYGPASRCRVNGECVKPRILRRRRAWLWAATILIALLLLFPYYVGWFL
jgi:mercuric ion transport protein